MNSVKKNFQRSHRLSVTPTNHCGRTLRIASMAALCLFTLLPLGCSDANGYVVPTTLTDVSGQVTLDGKPLPNVNVNFLPDGKTAGKGGFAVANAEGQFMAQDYSLAYGLEPGTYNVTFSRLQLPDGSALPPGQDAADVGAVESLPPHLTQVFPHSHPHRVTIDATPQDIQLELTSKPKRR